MDNYQKSMLRQWNMLRFVPREPMFTTADELTKRLADADFPIDKRTVERNLKELEQIFPLLVDDSRRPFKWCWRSNGATINLPGMSVPEALTLTLVGQHLQQHLPPSTLDALQPHFTVASQVLAAVDEKAQTKTWLNKVRSIATAQPLLPPATNEECQRTIYDALMKDRQLKLVYLKRDSDTPTVYESVHPVAVVQMGGIVYLACMFGEYTDVRTIALHRVKQAEMLYLPAREKEGFDIDAYISTGQFGVLAGGMIRLQAVFRGAAGSHLAETPLCEDQVLYREAPDVMRLIATVPHTRALVWWLLGFGDNVVVVEPAELRDEIRQTAHRMVAAYENDANARSDSAQR